MSADALARLATYHPLVIEGSSSNHDSRDALAVAHKICITLKEHWRRRPPPKEVIVMLQGDPFDEAAPFGIAAITRHVSDLLQIPRALVTLDESDDPEHSKLADRHGVILEMTYSQLASQLDVRKRSALTSAVDVALLEKNAARMAAEKPPAPSYFFDFALLQEVTKAATRKLCGGGLTCIHTMPIADISPTSVTSFYKVGLAMGLYDAEDVVAFSDEAADATESPAAPPVDVSAAESTASSAVCTLTFDIGLEAPLLLAVGASSSTATAKEAASRTAEGHAHWLLAHWWTPSQQRKHPGVSLILTGRSDVRVTITGAAAAAASPSDMEATKQAAMEEWGKAVGSALKKVDVDDLGDMDAANLLASIPEDDSSGRGLFDLRKAEKELGVKVVFCAAPCKHVLLVGPKAKLQKKCFMLRNLLSHYHWRLSGRDVAFEAMTAK